MQCTVNARFVNVFLEENKKERLQGPAVDISLYDNDYNLLTSQLQLLIIRDINIYFLHHYLLIYWYLGTF